MNVQFCLFACLPVLAYCSLFVAPAGQYWITFESFEKCSKDGSKEMIFDLHLRKTNRSTVVLYGNFSFKRDFDDNIKMRIEISNWGNGGWRSNMYNMEFDKDICKNSYTIFSKSRFENFMAKAGFPINSTNCIVPANNYRVDDIVVSNCYLESFPILIFGKYRATVSLFSAREELLGCFRMVWRIIRRY